MAEKEAIRQGLLEEKAPDVRWKYVLAWGFGSRSAAREAMAEIEEKVAGAVEAVGEMIDLTLECQ